MITVNLSKAKNIAHSIRRDARAIEFRPYDDLIARQIPGADTQAAEAARQAIRDRYTQTQTQIDTAVHIDDLTTVVNIMRENIQGLI